MLFSSRGSDDNVLSKCSQLGVMNKPSLSRTPFSFGTVAWSRPHIACQPMMVAFAITANLRIGNNVSKYRA